MPSPPRIAGIVVAAGQGARAGGDVPKQYRSLAGVPVVVRAAQALAAHPAIDTVVVVTGTGQEALFDRAFAGRPAPCRVEGGATRRESVCAGLAAVADHDIVLIHDAARPLLPVAVIDRLIAALDTHDGAVPVLPVVDSLATSDGAVLGGPVPRDGLARVQTPQAFRVRAITTAHTLWPDDREATDDAQVARAAGHIVATVEGDPMLEKLTHPGDFAAAEHRLAPTLVTRTGMGFDVHRFALDRDLWLGGVLIPHSHGLAGHSDADVALHALVDAILGAIGDGDIGSHFPPSDPQWRGAPSYRFLEHAASLVAARGGVIDHVDVTIICERPKVGPHREAIRARIAALLMIDVAQVSVKATTTEGLGFTGRGEGIAAQAIASVRIGGTSL